MAEKKKTPKQETPGSDFLEALGQTQEQPGADFLQAIGQTQEQPGADFLQAIEQPQETSIFKVGTGILGETSEQARGVVPQTQVAPPGPEGRDTQVLPAVQAGLVKLLAPAARTPTGEFDIPGIEVPEGTSPALAEQLSKPTSLVPDVTGQFQALSEAVAPPKGFEPETVVEELISETVALAPAFFVGGGKARVPQLLRGLLGKEGTAKAIEVSTPKLFNRARLARSSALRAADSAIKGGKEFGKFSGAASILGQTQVGEGKVDPGKVAKDTLIGAGLGILLNPALAPLAKQASVASRAKRIKRITKHKEATEALIKADRANRFEIIQVKRLDRNLRRLEKQVEEQLKVAKDETQQTFFRERATIKAGELIHRHKVLTKKSHDLLQGKAWKALVDAKEAFPNKLIEIGGKKVPAFELALSPRGFLFKPEELNILAKAKDIGKLQGSNVGVTDILRLVQQSEGRIRGPLRRMLIDPAEKANAIKVRETARWKQVHGEAIQRLGITGNKKRQAELFDLAEGRATVLRKPLTEGEREYINFTKTLYSRWLNSINKTNALFGFKKVKARRDYVTHLDELSTFERLGFRSTSDVPLNLVGRGLKKVKTTLRFERQRSGRAHQRNLSRAVDAYIEPAMRRIHMTKAASEIQARANWLPPNLRKAVDSWTQSALLGGRDPKDAALIASGLEPVLNLASGLSSAITRGVIGASLNVVVQQPSQILATAKMAGLRHTLRGLKEAWRQPPKALLNRSPFLKTRTIQDEFVPLTNKVLKRFDKWNGWLIEKTDGYVARASWYAGFNKAKALGLSDAAAVRLADDTARMLHASYQQLLKPALLRGQTGTAFLPFQSFSFNLWNLLTKDPRILAELRGTSAKREFAELVVALVGTNEVYNMLGLPSPFALKVPEEASLAGVRQAAGESLGIVPVAGRAKFGVPSPAAQLALGEVIGLQDPSSKRSIMNNLATAFLSDDEDQAEKAWKKIKGTIATLVPGGNQLWQTIQGIKAAKDGYYEVGREEVDIKGIDKAVAVALGPGKTRAVREERDRQELERIKKAQGQED